MPSLASRRFFALLVPLLLASCESGQYKQQIEARKMQIASEEPGSHYIGRRFHIDRTHFWGYLRKPRQDWDTSRLVVLNEKMVRAPDRLPEAPSGSGPAFGCDHNQEYKLWGFYTGRRIYDPNSNLMLPEFMLQRYELRNASPGWLFTPKERFNGAQLLRAEPESMPHAQ